MAGSVDESERDGGWSALMTAAEAGDAAGVAAAIAAGAEVNAADEDGWTALHLAALNDRADVVARLLGGAGGGGERADQVAEHAA